MTRSTGVFVLSACALVVALCIWAFGRSSPKVETPGPVISEGAEEPTAPSLSTERAMAAFFEDLPVEAPPVPSLSELVGEWEARVVSVELAGQASPLSLSTAAFPKFRFFIRADGEQYALAPTGANSRPRTLRIESGGIAAYAAAGQAPLRLRLSQDGLAGVMEYPSGNGRIEFHASRVH